MDLSQGHKTMQHIPRCLYYLTRDLKQHKNLLSLQFLYTHAHTKEHPTIHYTITQKLKSKSQTCDLTRKHINRQIHTHILTQSWNRLLPVLFFVYTNPCTIEMWQRSADNYCLWTYWPATCSKNMPTLFTPKSTAMQL